MKKGRLKKAAVIAVTIVFAALAAGAVYLTHIKVDPQTGGIKDVELAKTQQSLEESVWLDQQGEYVEVYLFPKGTDCWHALMDEGQIRGTWGTYTLVDSDEFSVIPYPDSYCDFTGVHTYSLSKDKKSIQIDGVTYKKGDYLEWLPSAYSDETEPEGGTY